MSNKVFVLSHKTDYEEYTVDRVFLHQQDAVKYLEVELKATWNDWSYQLNSWSTPGPNGTMYYLHGVDLY